MIYTNSDHKRLPSKQAISRCCSWQQANLGKSRKARGSQVAASCLVAPLAQRGAPEPHHDRGEIVHPMDPVWMLYSMRRPKVHSFKHLAQIHGHGRARQQGVPTACASSSSLALKRGGGRLCPFFCPFYAFRPVSGDIGPFLRYPGR